MKKRKRPIVKNNSSEDSNVNIDTTISTLSTRSGEDGSTSGDGTGEDENGNGNNEGSESGNNNNGNNNEHEGGRPIPLMPPGAVITPPTIGKGEGN
jgi:hypothetical protein